MWNYHPDAVVAAFVRFRRRASFTLQELQDYDVELFTINDGYFTSVLLVAGIPNPSRFDKSKLLMIAASAPGMFDQAVYAAAGIYKRALDLGVIA